MDESLQEMLSLGHRARKEHRTADSRAIFISAVRKAALEADRPSLAEALCGLGQAERDIGSLEAARHHYSNAALLYREIGPPMRLAFALRHEADTLREACLPTEAQPLYREAETIYRELGASHPLDLANTLRGLALAKQAAGQPREARPLWEEALKLYTQCGVEAGVAECRERLSQ